MTDKKIIFVVGHENWGKSKTLKALTNESRYVRNYKVGGKVWFVRRMSNDDRPGSYYDFMASLNKKYLIAAFCPNFDEKRCDRTVDLLNQLKSKGYELYLWVLKKQFTTEEEVRVSFIEKLKDFGAVEVYSEDREANVRAHELKRYIEKCA